MQPPSADRLINAADLHNLRLTLLWLTSAAVQVFCLPCSLPRTSLQHSLACVCADHTTPVQSLPHCCRA